MDDGAFPYPRLCPVRPPHEYDRLRSQKPPVRRVVLASGRGAWLIARYDDIRRVLASPAVSSDMAAPGYPLQFDVPAEVMEQLKPALLSDDPPAHTARRRAVMPGLTARRVGALRPRIEEIVDDRISGMLSMAQPVDLVDALAVPVPSLVICELMGVPAHDREFFQLNARRLVSLGTGPAERQNALDGLRGYFAELIEEKTGSQDDDLLSRLVRLGPTHGLGPAEMVSLATVLLVGGHETTAKMIGLGVMALLDDPVALAASTASEDAMTAAVDELLRYFSIADQVTARVALSDVDVAGVTIPAGEGIIALTASGNHDERVFSRPHELLVDRPGRSHLAFGHGAHQCVGQHLAKLELEIVLTRVFRRMPGLRLACPVDALRFSDSAGVYGLEELPVRWEKG